MSIRAMLTGVSGLKAHQVRLDVTAANIANVNTIGYRSSRTLFQDLFSQTIRGGSAPVGGFGGTNPQQVGLGTRIASINTNFAQGSLITTGADSDLAIQGNGFFVLTDGTRTGYSRDGSFALNSNGLLVEPASGMRVQGFLADSTGVINSNSAPSDLLIPVGGTAIAKATQNAEMIGNLNSDAVANETVLRTLQLFDSLGTSRSVDITFTKLDTTGGANRWSYDVAFGATSGGSGTLVFTNAGTLTPTPGVTDPGITFPGATLAAGSDVEPEDLQFTLNMNELTQYAQGREDVGGTSTVLPSTATMRNQDGFELGVLESFNIGASGEINGIFTNGLTRTIAQVALASFANNGGLTRDGNNIFIETPSSGPPQIGVPNSGGRGVVNGGVLENSNVDLGTEFSDMIITQRGFQANARTITAADTLLQETVNLIR